MGFLEWWGIGEISRWGLEVVHTPKHTHRESPTASLAVNKENTKNHTPNASLPSGVLSPVPATNWRWPSASARTKSQSAVTAECQHPWEVFRVEIRNETPCALGKTDKTGLQIVRYFQDEILWAHFLCCLIFKILHGDVCSLWLAVTVCKNACLIPCTLLSPKSHTYWPFPASLEPLPRPVWNAVSQAVDIILPQIELNSQLSHCAFIFFQLTPGSSRYYAPYSESLGEKEGLYLSPMTQAFEFPLLSRQVSFSIFQVGYMGDSLTGVGDMSGRLILQRLPSILTLLRVPTVEFWFCPFLGL